MDDKKKTGINKVVQKLERQVGELEAQQYTLLRHMVSLQKQMDRLKERRYNKK